MVKIKNKKKKNILNFILLTNKKKFYQNKKNNIFLKLIFILFQNIKTKKYYDYY